MNDVSDHDDSHLEHISAEVSAVLDPMAVRCRGWSVDAIRPLIAEAWRRTFRTELGEAALAGTASAIRDGRPWCGELRTGGW